MQNLDPKVIILFFIKNFLGSVYVLPLWFIGVFIFEKVWTGSIPGVSEDGIILLLDGAGAIFLSLLILVCYIWSWLTFIHFSYELQTDGLHIYKGVIFKRHYLIAYPDIESIDTLINPFAVRFLGLYSLYIKTHDVENTEGLFRKKQAQLILGLSLESVQYLRPELLKYSHIQKAKKIIVNPTNYNSPSHSL